MRVTRTIQFAGVDGAVHRLLQFLAPSVSATLVVSQNFEDFVDVYRRNAPECLVLDGHAAAIAADRMIPELRTICSRIPIIIAMGNDGDDDNASDGDLQDRLLDAGAVAIVPAEDSPRLRSVLVSSLAMSAKHERLRIQTEQFKHRLAGLSSKHRRVLDALIQGGSNKQIAGEHGVSERTLERRRAELIVALNVRSVIEAAWWFGRSSLPEPGEPFRWPPLDPDGVTANESIVTDEVAK